jgi:hypothetical protein
MNLFSKLFGSKPKDDTEKVEEAPVEQEAAPAKEAPVEEAVEETPEAPAEEEPAQ